MANTPDWVTLTDGETVVWQGQPTLYHYVGQTIFGVVLIGFGLLFWLIAGDVIEIGVAIPTEIPGGLIGGVIVLIGITISVKRLLEWWSIRYLLTSKEVYRKSGVISRSVTNLNLNQIQNTSFTQSITGRLLSHGHVHIETAGSSGTEITFWNVPDPEEVVGYITEELEELHS